MESISRPTCHHLREATLSPSDGPMGDHVQDELIGPWIWEEGEAHRFSLSRVSRGLKM